MLLQNTQVHIKMHSHIDLYSLEINYSFLRRLNFKKKKN